jgi:2,4-dienoyl-CoA reductase-like NADH-dependent reductase (Old Yellow Enzyme family)
MPGLFSPIELRGVVFENRIVVSPMCQYSATEGTATDWHMVNLGQLAVSGPGLVFFEATHVSPEGRITPNCLGLYSDANEAGMERTVRFIRRWGNGKIGVQLAHAGRKASTLPPWEGGGPVRDGRGWTPVAPSSLAYDVGSNLPHELNDAGMQKVRDDFVAAATRCVRLGVDVIELHFAHGYLAHEFLSPLSNHRSDRYGGVLANRMAFPLELVDAVRAVWPERLPLFVRISASDWVDGGWNAQEAIAFSRECKRRGVDAIDCSSGGLSPRQQIDARQGYQVAFARKIRRETGIATVAIGMITDPFYAQRVIEEGEADFVALARAFLRDPRWVWTAADLLAGEAFVPHQYARGRKTVLAPRP